MSSSLLRRLLASHRYRAAERDFMRGRFAEGFVGRADSLRLLHGLAGSRIRELSGLDSIYDTLVDRVPFETAEASAEGRSESALLVGPNANHEDVAAHLDNSSAEALIVYTNDWAPVAHRSRAWLFLNHTRAEAVSDDFVRELNQRYERVVVRPTSTRVGVFSAAIEPSCPSGVEPLALPRILYHLYFSGVRRVDGFGFDFYTSQKKFSDDYRKSDPAPVKKTRRKGDLASLFGHDLAFNHTLVNKILDGMDQAEFHGTDVIRCDLVHYLSAFIAANRQGILDANRSEYHRQGTR